MKSFTFGFVLTFAFLAAISGGCSTRDTNEKGLCPMGACAVDP
jgi:hypothetical protein